MEARQLLRRRGSAVLRYVKALTSDGRAAEDTREALEAPGVKYDLGGLRRRDGWLTVNLAPGATIRHDITDLDAFCDDASADVIYLSHTLEHIPLVKLGEFLTDALRKLRPGGRLVAIQTDARKTIGLYSRRRIDFGSLRDVLFSPLATRTESVEAVGADVMAHQYMWGARDLAAELRETGFVEVRTFDAGTWKFDVPSTFSYQRNERYFGVRIPNLGVEGRAPNVATAHEASQRNGSSQ